MTLGDRSCIKQQEMSMVSSELDDFVHHYQGSFKAQVAGSGLPTDGPVFLGTDSYC
jgi:hypothetical protein